MAVTGDNNESGRENYASARKLQEETLGRNRHLLGEEHPDTLSAMSNLAVTLGEQGDLTGARELQEQVLEAPKFRCRRITVIHSQRRRTAPQNHSPEVQILFNVHNPSQDHRDRAACDFLLTL